MNSEWTTVEEICNDILESEKDFEMTNNKYNNNNYDDDESIDQLQNYQADCQ